MNPDLCGLCAFAREKMAATMLNPYYTWSVERFFAMSQVKVRV